MRTLHVPPFLDPQILNDSQPNDIPYASHMADVASHNPHSADIALLVANSLSASPAPPADSAGSTDDLPRSHATSRPTSTQPPSATTAEIVGDDHSLSPEGQAQQATMAIQTLLASVNNVPRLGSNSKENGQDAVWNADRASHPHSPDPSRSNGQPSSSKRRLEDPDEEEAHAKIRRTVQEHVTAPEADRVVSMTTVVCLHAAVAQKSYGSEKRFLTPPPLVRVEGPYGAIPDQKLAMSIVGENGERGPQAVVPLDSSLTAAFKFLHVTGAAKAKSFNLALEITSPGSQNTHTSPWAVFESAPVTIISKPSKKTAKTRNIASCILAGGPVSLFNRINSQTVRTKYMTIDNTHLCASNVLWSAFNVNVIQRGPEVTPIGSPQPVTYGSEIILSDSMTGIATSPLFIRKVDKGRISDEEGGPVSQMQKIALQRVNQDGTRHYLSAAGPLPGTPGGRHNNADSGGSTHHLLFVQARLKEERKEDGTAVVRDEVDDYLCWTIVGISKFQYTFFDALQKNKIPEIPITPFPTLFQAPAYRVPSHTLDLTISSFFYDNPKTGHRSPLEIWLGEIGPLTHRVINAPPAGPLTNISSTQYSYQNAAQDSAGTSTGSPTGDGSPPSSSGGFAQAATSQASQMMPPPENPPFVQPGPLHTNILVDLPPIQDIMKALQNDAARAAERSGVDGDPSSGGVSTAPPDSAASGGSDASHPHLNFVGRSLPLLFIRGADGVGYHSGRTIALDNLYVSLNQGNGPSGHPPVQPDWMITAATAAHIDGNLQGWTLKVI